MNLDFFRFDAGQSRLRQLAAEVAPAPEDRGGRAKHARPKADRSRTHVIGKEAGDGHGHHHSGPGPRLDSREDAAPEIVGHMPQKLRCVQNRADGDRCARQRDKQQRTRERRRLAE